MTEQQLLDAVRAAGGTDALAWHTTALALVDGPTRALTLATRVAERPSELASSVAELLGARAVTDRLAASGPPVPHGAGRTVLRVTTPWHGVLTFERPDEPFTPAESARAHRRGPLRSSRRTRARHMWPRSDLRRAGGRYDEAPVHQTPSIRWLPSGLTPA